MLLSDPWSNLNLLSQGDWGPSKNSSALALFQGYKVAIPARTVPFQLRRKMTS